jgi:flagellar motility protein MotE (MotC chaperone)
VVDSLNTVIRAKKEVEKNFAEKEKELEKLREALGLNNKKEYNDWIASTVKLYESMDSKQAAKIITNYSDNVARDIIYAMKKKKAAEILSNLNSEQIVKLTRADDGL